MAGKRVALKVHLMDNLKDCVMAQTLVVRRVDVLAYSWVAMLVALMVSMWAAK